MTSTLSILSKEGIVGTDVLLPAVDLLGRLAGLAEEPSIPGRDPAEIGEKVDIVFSFFSFIISSVILLFTDSLPCENKVQSYMV